MLNRITQNAMDMGITISNKEMLDLEVFVKELKRWNQKFNLTAIEDDQKIAVKHILDSLTISRFLNGDENVLDIGSGAGFPGIPIKIIKPKLSIVSVDAVQKKINFQKHVARMLMFENFEALHIRGEELQSIYSEKFDVIVSRAFSSLENFVLLTKPLLSKSGLIIAMKGPAAEEEISNALPVIGELNLEIKEVYPYQLPFNSGERRIVVIRACKAC